MIRWFILLAPVFLAGCISSSSPPPPASSKVVVPPTATVVCPAGTTC